MLNQVQHLTSMKLYLLFGKITNQVRNDSSIFDVTLNLFQIQFNLLCHAELAAKSVETMSKRDFMPLPGVSASDQYEIIFAFW